MYESYGFHVIHTYKKKRKKSFLQYVRGKSDTNGQITSNG